jgi:uncharacterized protein YndB with AHSA1/START domain
MSTQESLDIRREIAVACDPAHAFRTFTEGIGSWWPLAVHSVAAQILEIAPGSVRFEPGPDGSIVEVLPDGGETPWARVRAWDPPHRLVLGWKPNPTATAETEIEVRFTAQPGGTLVVLEHRGFELLSSRDEYAEGWPTVLARFAEAAGGAGSV